MEENKEKKEKKEKTNILGAIIAVLLGLIVIIGGAFTYMYYEDNFTNKSDDSEVEPTPIEDEKEINLDLNDKDLSNLYDIWVKVVLYNESFSSGNSNTFVSELEKNTDASKIIVALLNLESEKISCKNVNDLVYNEAICGDADTSDSKYWINDGWSLDLKNEELLNLFRNSSADGYKMSDVDSKIKELYGNVSYNKVDVYLYDVGLPCHYDSGVDSYILYSCTSGCGGNHLHDGRNNKLLSASKKGNTITMIVAKEEEIIDNDVAFDYEEFKYVFEYNNSTNSYVFKSFEQIK